MIKEVNDDSLTSEQYSEFSRFWTHPAGIFDDHSYADGTDNSICIALQSMAEEFGLLELSCTTIRTRRIKI